MNEAERRLLIIIAYKLLPSECDNIGGDPREECQCDTCKGWRIFNHLAYGNYLEEEDLRP